MGLQASPHMLVAGATSTGKTSLLMTIATQCARRGFNVVWVDPKGFDSPGMRDWPNVSLVTAGTDEDGLVGHTAVLRFLADTMRERLPGSRSTPTGPTTSIRSCSSPMSSPTWWSPWRSSTAPTAPPKRKGPRRPRWTFGILLRTARAVGIHMALGIQRPDTMFIAGEPGTTRRYGWPWVGCAPGRRDHDVHDAVAGTRCSPASKAAGRCSCPTGPSGRSGVLHPKVPATAEQRAQLSDHERDILRRLGAVDSFWPRRVGRQCTAGLRPHRR